LDRLSTANLVKQALGSWVEKQRGKLPDSTKVFKGSFGEVSFLALHWKMRKWPYLRRGKLADYNSNRVGL
jgi:hypothetical protein